ncbi:MAG: glycoside hydrolase [Actinobacteria bacterium]|nr:glycoside hydrolase [Actinomycetota bacterium]
MRAVPRHAPRGVPVDSRDVLLAGALLTLAAAVVAFVVLVHSGGATGGREATAGAAASAFGSEYVQPGGRVSRVDQGGDTVSEGQAYGMLIAAANGESERFASVWGWARENLRQPNGLLAWHWENGQVVATQSAADADLDAAWALLVASRRFGSARYRAEGLALAHAILEHETVSLDGRSLLVAGDWATTFPAIVDPSYFAPAAVEALGRASGDPRWAQLAETSREVLAQLTSRPTGLPPDWAVVESDGTARPTPPPGKGGEALFGYDAVRVPLWEAASCVAGDRGVAARAAPFLGRALRRAPAATYSLGGEPHGGPPGAPIMVAAAAASAAAGEPAASQEWLARAGAAVESDPTYYGGALVALARAALEPKGGLAC